MLLLPFKIRDERLLLSEHLLCGMTALGAQTAKRLSAMRETWVRSLGREDALEKEMSARSSIPA